MDRSIEMQFDNLIERGDSILQGYCCELGRVEAQEAEVGRDFLAHGANTILAEVFGSKEVGNYGKKATKAWLSAQKKQVRKDIVSKYGSAYATWLQEISSFLSQVSIWKRGLIAPGNSTTLIRRVRRADKYVKLETRLSKAIAELRALRAEGLVFNSALPKEARAKAGRPADGTKTLESLEKLMRTFIERELGTAGSNWWQDRVPADIRRNAERKKDRRETVSPWHPSSSDNVVDYLDFSDYRKIILEPKNWQQVFEKFFKVQSFVDVKLGELELIRNDLAHFRPIEKLAVDKLRIYSVEIANCVNLAR